MRTNHKNWTIAELVQNIDKIEFPEFQREPTVWKLEKKQRLIDSIFRDFDISSIYFYRKENGSYDCIDGRQRINAILSYLGINGSDEDDNGFHLKVQNEIYDDGGIIDEIDQKRYSAIQENDWGSRFRNYRLNIVEITQVENDEELNLLFLRLQIASVLNAGEKLHAMTGDMRNTVFYDISKHPFFEKLNIPNRRYARETVASQIVLNGFNIRDTGTFHRSRFVDLQDFFKAFSKFEAKDKETIRTIMQTLDKINEYFGDKVKYINNRAMAVSIYLFVDQLLRDNKEEEICPFAEFFEKFLKTLKWQLPLGVRMDPAYHDLLKFQTNVVQAAGEKSAIERRSDFLNEWFHFYKQHHSILGDENYLKNTGIQADPERGKIVL